MSEQADEASNKAQEIVKAFRKQAPDVRIFKGSDPQVQIQVQPFGVREVDDLCRGIKCGGYTVLYGPNKAGKTTLVGRAIAEMQRAGRKVLVIDLENRIDPQWLALQGVDLDALDILVGGKDFEEDMDVAFALIREGIYGGMIVDSLTAKAARGELEDKAGKQKSMTDDTVALLARKLSEWFRKVTPSVGYHKIPVIILSQVRATNLHSGAFLDMTGGNAPKHWASTILKITRASKIQATKGGEKLQLGYWMRVELKKTSICANEGKMTQVPFYFGIGIDDLAAAVRAGIKDGIVQAGATARVTFQEKSYASENQLVEKAREDPELADALIVAVSGKAPTDQQGDDPEKDADDAAAPEDKSTDGGSEAGDLICEECGFEANTPRGKKIHVSRVHGTA